MGWMDWMGRWWEWGGTDVRQCPPEHERQNRTATIGWLVAANKGRMGHMDLMGRLWDGDGMDKR